MTREAAHHDVDFEGVTGTGGDGADEGWGSKHARPSATNVPPTPHPDPAHLHEMRGWPGQITGGPGQEAACACSLL